MKDNSKILEPLLERVIDYGKTSCDLAKLKTIDKTSDVVSSFLPYSIVLFLIGSFILFLSLGLALWLGELLGKTYLGFLVVAALYAIKGIFFYFFMRKWFKRIFRNYLIKQLQN